jgi:hypothetical protein
MGWFKSRHNGIAGSLDKDPVSSDEPFTVSCRTGSEPVQNRFRTGAEARTVRRALPSRLPKFSRPIEHIAAATQAAALLQLLQEEVDQSPGQMIGFAEIYKIYVEMCWQNHWREQGWAKVGREFNRLTTNGAKLYAMFYDDDGRGRRLRVYRIPLAKPG